MGVRTCVSAQGGFVCGVHKPCYRVVNLRSGDGLCALGSFPDGESVRNDVNFPQGDVTENAGHWIFEIPNPFPFLGTTYIDQSWAAARCGQQESFRLPEPPSVSFGKVLAAWQGTVMTRGGRLEEVLGMLPEPLLLALAITSTDADDLEALAKLSCPFVYDRASGRPTGLCYEKNDRGRVRSVLYRPCLFEALANNSHLPEDYRLVMVLRPGAQGASEIVGEYRDELGRTHVYEYLRRNSYIPWGHYAANMAEDAVRYRIADLSLADMTGLRHLYYQRTYVRLAEDLGLAWHGSRRSLSDAELEQLRGSIVAAMARPESHGRLSFTATLWGWNFGFDFAPTEYRLHASHQQIHQQYALIPSRMETVAGLSVEASNPDLSTYAYGDQVATFVQEFRAETGRPFFASYLEAIRNNRRPDGRQDVEQGLVVWEDEQVMIFVPKAQTSQWELQIMTKAEIGNILEADAATRSSLDLAILLIMKILSRMGARMVTCIEISKRFDSLDSDHRLLYGFFPRLPESPGAFSEAQRRYIVGHFPEDFAAACRLTLADVLRTEDIERGGLSA